MSLVRPLGMIFPCAGATISTVPTHAQTKAAQTRAIIVAAIARPAGDAGVSVISRAAGRKASSYSPRRTGCFGKAIILRLADGIDASLQEVKFCVAAIAADQLIMAAVLDDPTALEGDDAI